MYDRMMSHIFMLALVLVTQYVMNMLISNDHELMIKKDNLCEGAVIILNYKI